jgi:hypothetical protein
MASSGHGILGLRRRLAILVLLPLLAGAIGYWLWSRYAFAPVDPARTGILSVAPPGGGDVWAQTTTTRPMSTEAAAAEVDLVWQRELHNHAVLLTSLHHYKRFISDYGSPLRATPWFKSRANSADVLLWLNRHVHAEVLPGTSLIQISVDDRSHDCSDQDAAAIVRAVGDAYVSDFQDAALRRSRANQEDLTVLRFKYAADLEQAEGTLARMRAIRPEDRDLDFEFRREKFTWEFTRARESLAEVQHILDRVDFPDNTQSPGVRWRARPTAGE